jgi:hypothetical protein
VLLLLAVCLMKIVTQDSSMYIRSMPACGSSEQQLQGCITLSSQALSDLHFEVFTADAAIFAAQALART